MEQSRVIAITMGDPAGVGPEVCLKAISRWADRSVSLVIFGDGDALRLLGQKSGLAVPPISNHLSEACDLAALSGASVYHIDSLGTDWQPGMVSAKTGEASYHYITTAIETAMNHHVGQPTAHHVDAIVTGPIHKEALRQSGVSYPGHTEIFESLTKSPRACMMLTSDALTCSFVTTHVGLCEVPRLISTERVLDVIELTHEAIFKIKGRTPSLVACGLNPHAGESGLFGDREEERFIIPAIELARDRGIQIEGPLPPDTAFLPAGRRVTDAYVCMYHDQGHIPLKALSFETAVNTTLGLPIIRTSVDHGTALDIAWKSFNADETSMLQAIRLATQLSVPAAQPVSGSLG